MDLDCLTQVVKLNMGCCPKVPSEFMYVEYMNILFINVLLEKVCYDKSRNFEDVRYSGFPITTCRFTGVSYSASRSFQTFKQKRYSILSQ